MAQRLYKYTRGTWAGFINQPTNVDINKKFVVFSVRDMEEELRPIAMYIILQHIWNIIRSDLRKRIIVVDGDRERHEIQAEIRGHVDKLIFG